MMKSIQSRLGFLMVAMLSMALAVNLFVFIQSHSMMRRIDSVFVSNVSIVELTDALNDVQENVYEYLNTRSSRSLENFYRYGQEYRDLCGDLGNRIIDSEALMLEKNIRAMSESYLDVSEQAVQAKRGRNVEEYREYYQSATDLYGYINTYIYELNTLRFAQNSENYRILMRSVNMLELLSLLLIISVFAISVFLAFVVIRQMVGPLRSLAGAADLVAAGDMEVEIPESRSADEVGVVTNAFRGMLDSIRQYILRQRTAMENEARMKENELSMRAHLQEAQLKFLQAQINPHFLFNSLNAASQLATMEGADRTEEFLAHMADYFRYNVRKTEGDATLYEEVESADNYIFILNVRFAGDISYEKEIDPEIDLTGIRMPSMILQPIVENAIQHGIHDDHEHGRVTLYIEKVEGRDNETGIDCVRITVADNGMGMTREQIDALMTRGARAGAANLSGGAEDEAAAGITVGEENGAGETGEAAEEDSGQSGSGTGIALVNVISRLALYYNEENLFSIWSDGPGMGTEVTVLLPVGEGRPEPGEPD